MVSVNVEAKKTVDVMIEKADELNIAVETLDLKNSHFLQ